MSSSPNPASDAQVIRVMTRFRIIMLAYAVIVIGLAVAGTVALTAVAHDKPLHRAYACDFHKAGDQQWHLPATPCRTEP